MSWLLGNAGISFTHSPKTVELPSKAGKPVALADLCKSVTPPCRLNPLLFNGHLQTAYPFMSKGPEVPIHYKRKIFEAEDPMYPGSYAVDFVSHVASETKDPTLPRRTNYFDDAELESLEAGSDDNKPMLVTLHGLSGGSYELYLRLVLAPLVNVFEDPSGEVDTERWEVCVINSRGCARSKITSTVLYNARATWDTRQTVKWLRKKFPNRPLFGIGFSLGANILTNYIGEEGADCQLKAAVLISNPWNLEIGSMALQRTWLGLEVYSKAMGTNMKKLFETHVEQIKKNPNVDIEKVRNTTYLHDFDRELQGPTWGYPTEGAYYRDASSTDSLLAVRIPVFAIHAEDDPIAVREALPWLETPQNPYAVLCTTSMGGHLSWLETGGSRWFVKPTVNFLRKMAEEMDLDEFPKTRESVDKNSLDSLRPIYQPMRRKLNVLDVKT